MLTKIKNALLDAAGWIMAIVWVIVRTVASGVFRHLPFFGLVAACYALSYLGVIEEPVGVLAWFVIGLLILNYMETNELRRDMRKRAKGGVVVNQTISIPHAGLREFLAEAVRRSVDERINRGDRTNPAGSAVATKE
ncbi:hypothetical protein [Achromobacter sp. AGC39]